MGCEILCQHLPWLHQTFGQRNDLDLAEAVALVASMEEASSRLGTVGAQGAHSRCTAEMSGNLRFAIARRNLEHFLRMVRAGWWQGDNTQEGWTWFI